MKIIFSFGFLLFSTCSFCQYDAIRPQGIYSSNFIIDEKPRTITYYMPSTYGKQDMYPLLVVLHPENSNATTVIKKYGDIIQSKADSAGCIVLYPDAYRGHWNSNLKDTVNDIGFINIMADFFVRQFGCDLSNLKMLGIGNGGNLCYRFICESVYKPAAVVTLAATAGTNSPGCQNQITIPHQNITTVTITKASVAQALSYLFARRETK